MLRLFPELDQPVIPVAIAQNADLRIAISGKSGCGNSTVSSMLAEKMNLSLLNYTFRNLATDMRMTMSSLAARAENDISIDWYIETKQIQHMQQHACVLASRMAIWLVKGHVLRIYLYAHAEVRAKRIALREFWDYKTAYRNMTTRDEQDRRRLMERYNIDINNYSCADYTVDVNNTAPETAVENIIEFIRKKQSSPPSLLST